MRKMTVQEAIDAIKIKEMQIECKATRMLEFCEGLTMAEEALEKQIPVKPIHVIHTPENTRGYHGRKHHRVYCGVCGKFTQRVYIGDKYCRECGTRIDWSEDENTK